MKHSEEPCLFQLRGRTCIRTLRHAGAHRDSSGELFVLVNGYPANWGEDDQADVTILAPMYKVVQGDPRREPINDPRIGNGL